MRARILAVLAASAALSLAAVAADTASAMTLEHIRTELSKSKVPAGSIPGHPDQTIVKKLPPTPVPQPAPGGGISSSGNGGQGVPIYRSPNPDEPGYVAPASHGTVHQYHGPSCHDDVCESE
jgi:hypothetical protein